METNCIKDLKTPNSPIVTIVDNFNSDNSVIATEGKKLFIETDLKAPNKRIVTVDFSKSNPDKWVDLLQRQIMYYHHQQVLFFFANYMKDAVSVVKQYDYSGKMLREIQPPAVGTAGGFMERKKTKHYITSLLITQRQEQSILLILTQVSCI
jgi:prolyl oligopeptidase